MEIVNKKSPKLERFFDVSSCSNIEKNTLESARLLDGIFCNIGITAHLLGSHCKLTLFPLLLIWILPVVAPKPLDEETILNSVRKTGRLVVADGDWKFLENRIYAETAGMIWGKDYLYNVLLNMDSQFQEALLNIQKAKQIME